MSTKQMAPVGQKEVQAYENVRQSGITNMFDVKKVCELSGLERDQVIYIMEDYGRLTEKFNIQREKLHG